MIGKSNRLAVLCIGLVAPILIIVTRLAWGASTPDPLPTHWDAGGHVDGTTAATPFFWWTLILSAGLALSGAAIAYQRRSPEAGRLLVAMLVGGSWQVASIYVLCVSISRNAVNAQSVSLPWFALVLTVAVPLAVGVLIWFLLPLRPVAPQQLPHSTVRLAPTERVTWLSHAHSKPIRIAAAALVAAALVVFFFDVGVAVIFFAVGILMAGASEVAVRVDHDGLHTLWGPVGWPRQVTHLDSIAAVHAEIIHPMKWGGWGYRITGSGTAANVRTGPGIVVQRTDGTTYVVTVDHAPQGADVLNALLSRDRQSG